MKLLRTLTLATLAAWLAVMLALFGACRALAWQPEHAGPGRWVTIKAAARVTYYGPGYAGRATASGVIHTDDGWYCALGPRLLTRARALTGETWPSVRLAIPGERCRPTLPVRDTGSDLLEVDLPDQTWLALSPGVDPSWCIFYADLEVWADG